MHTQNYGSGKSNEGFSFMQGNSGLQNYQSMVLKPQVEKATYRPLIKLL